MSFLYYYESQRPKINVTVFDAPDTAISSILKYLPEAQYSARPVYYHGGRPYVSIELRFLLYFLLLLDVRSGV